MKLSVIIPVRNEEDVIQETVQDICAELKNGNVDSEIIIVNDNSTDATAEKIALLSAKYSNIRIIKRHPPSGFGWTVRDGIAFATGDAIAIVMGDGSDDPRDIVKYYRKLQEGYDCVFGSRFIKGTVVKDYPFIKLIFNRIGNYFIKMLFRMPYNDVTNAFKLYRKEVIESVKPLVSNYFNITVEIPLKAIIRGFSYAIVPINWYGRTSGVSKYNLNELQRKYLFSIFYVWLEKVLLKEEVKNAKQKK